MVSAGTNASWFWRVEWHLLEQGAGLRHPGRLGEGPVAATRFPGSTSLQDRFYQGQRRRLKRQLAQVLFRINLKSHVSV